MDRRTFLKSSFAGFSVLSGLYAWQIEPFWLEFVHIKMPIKNLPDDLVGKTLMQISDIHSGKRFDYHYIIESFKKAQAYQPDYVVYTGDYVSTHKKVVQFDIFDEVYQHIVKGKISTIGILGNHDYGHNWSEMAIAEKIIEKLTNFGMKILRNEQIEVNGLNFIGFDDYWGLNFNPTLAISKFDKNKANIVLCHNPDVCDLDIWKDYNSWILSGHTHGGQCKPPFLNAPLLPVKNSKYSSGLITLDDERTLYINRALGHLWQVRFNVRPEITIFELQKV